MHLAAWSGRAACGCGSSKSGEHGGCSVALGSSYVAVAVRSPMRAQTLSYLGTVAILNKVRTLGVLQARPSLAAGHARPVGNELALHADTCRPSGGRSRTRQRGVCARVSVMHARLSMTVPRSDMKAVTARRIRPLPPYSSGACLGRRADGQRDAVLRRGDGDRPSCIP